MSDLSLEELLKTLEEAEKASPKTKAGSLKKGNLTDRFVEEFEVEVGTDRVPNYVIFYTFRVKWKVRSEESKISFFRAFNKKFTQVRTGRQRCYLLNGDNFDLSREGKIEAEFYDKRYQKRIKENRKAKKRKALSRKEKKHKA